MTYYLLRNGEQVAYVPSDASEETLMRCEQLRRRVVRQHSFPACTVDRAIGVIEGGRK